MLTGNLNDLLKWVSEKKTIAPESLERHNFRHTDIMGKRDDGKKKAPIYYVYEHCEKNSWKFRQRLDFTPHGSLYGSLKLTFQIY